MNTCPYCNGTKVEHYYNEDGDYISREEWIEEGSEIYLTDPYEHCEYFDNQSNDDASDFFEDDI